MPKTYQLFIEDKIWRTKDAASFVLKKPEPDLDLFNYTAGQYLGVFIDGKISRSYSLSSHPSEEFLEVTIKRKPGGVVSNYLLDKKMKSETLEVSPPQGNFFKGFDPGVETFFLAAAGSGIVPIFSILKEVLILKDRKVILFYCNKNESQTIFLEELKKLETQYSNQLQVEWRFTQTPCRVTENNILDWIVKYDLKPNKTDFYLCGPEGFMETIQKGLPPHYKNVYKESFVIEQKNAKATSSIDIKDLDACDDLNSNITLTDANGNRHEIENSPGSTILESIMAAGVEVPYSCLSGNCTACMARLNSGKVSMAEETCIDSNEVKKGLFLTCQSKVSSSEISLSFDEVD